MYITLESFDKIIHPGAHLVAAPHTFTATKRRHDSIEERASIRRQIDQLHAKAGELSYDDELLRQSDLRRRQKDLAGYPELALQPIPTYVIDDTMQVAQAARHGKV